MSHPARQLPPEKHVVRITNSGSINAYVAYAERQLHDPAVARVELRAVAAAIVKAVTVAEILKRHNSSLVQQNVLTKAVPAARATASSPPEPQQQQKQTKKKSSPARLTSSLVITLVKEGQTEK